MELSRNNFHVQCTMVNLQDYSHIATVPVSIFYSAQRHFFSILFRQFEFGEGSETSQHLHLENQFHVSEPGLRLKLSFWNLKSYNKVPRPHRRTSGMSLHPEVTHPWTLKICIFYELIYYDALHNVTNLSFYLDMIHILTVLIQRYSSFLQ